MKVTITNVLFNDCECGKEVMLEKYVMLKESESRTLIGRMTNEEYDKRKKYIGFCECGNVFIAKE